MNPPREIKQLVTVLIVDNHANARTTLKKALSLDKRVTVVGEAVDGTDAIAKASELAPDVVLMDVKMPEMSGIEATRHIKKHNPEIKVIMFSAYDEKSLIEEALKSGASNYFLKNDPVEEVVEVVLFGFLD